MVRRRIMARQLAFPAISAVQVGDREIPITNDRIPLQQILRALQCATTESRGVIDIYRQEVLPIKTRTIQLLGRKNSARILHTLLGFEIKSAYKRVHCPDLVTARYLKVFSELGCRSIKLPYDPTVTARIIPELEASVARVVSGTQQLFPHDRRLQVYVLQRLYRLIRKQLR